MISNLQGKNLYSILGITPDADKATIKAAFRSLAKKYHPDTNKGNKDSEIKFKEINNAYKILSDNLKRYEYDKLNGFNILKNDKPTYTNYYQANQTYKNQATSHPKQESTHKNTEKKEKDESISESFHKFVNDVFFNTTANTFPTNKDIKINLTISSDEADKGTTRQINIRHTECCPCCKGRKFINDVKCSKCDGTGEITSTQNISVKIPPNTKNGDIIKIKKENNKVYSNTDNIYIFIKIIVEKNSLFRFDNLDVLSDIPISPTEAALGTTVSVPTLNGKVNMKIPPETSSGQKFKLHDLGVFDKENNIRGNHIVTVFIKMPKNLSEQEKTLYEKLSKIRNFNPRNDNING